MPLSTRGGRRWHIVWQGPRLGFVAEKGNCVTADPLSTIFLLFFVLCFLLKKQSFSPSLSRYVAPCFLLFYAHFLHNNNNNNNKITGTRYENLNIHQSIHTNSKRFWTRADVDGGQNKGPPQTSQGAKSMLFRWRSRDERKWTHQHTNTHKGSKNSKVKRYSSCR